MQLTAKEPPSSSHPDDERARKRQAIGLSPQRPTAKSVVEQPPEQAGGRRRIGALLVLLTVVALGWLLWVNPGTIGPGTGDDEYPLLVRDDFTAPHLALAEEVVAGHWAMGFDADRYQIRIEAPGTLAWTTLGQMNLGGHRLTVPLRLADGGAAGQAWGFAGLLMRYQNDENFYLFVVDGQGSYQVQLQEEGSWRLVQPWTPSSALTGLAGENLLMAEDDGATLRFYANGRLLHTVGKPRLPIGDVGLVAGTRSQGRATAYFDWLELRSLSLAP